MNKTGVFLVRSETIDYEENDRYCDNYTLKDISPMSSKDVNLYVDFEEGTVSGDIVAYGSWYDLDENDVVEYLGALKEDEIIRSFDHLINKERTKNKDHELEM